MALDSHIEGTFASPALAKRSKSGLRREREASEIKPGDIFRRIHADKTVETALVLGLQQGPIGIPHVRFSVHFERSRFAFFDDGPRILALARFTEHYRD